MGILSRASYVIRSKLNALLNRAEDPTETLDYSYERLRDELQDVKKGIADLTTQKKRLEIQKRRLEENVEKHNAQARQAVEQDRDDLARQALEKKKKKMRQIEEREAQIADLQSTQDDLVDKKNGLQSRIEEFRT
ncbi:MAG: PspA/IM30 family protein, partial [Natronomonas sp.]